MQRLSLRVAVYAGLVTFLAAAAGSVAAQRLLLGAPQLDAPSALAWLQAVLLGTWTAVAGIAALVGYLLCRQWLSGPASAVGLRPLALQLEEAHDELALTREHAGTANAIHQRFLAGLGQELGTPLRLLLTTIERLDAQGGRLDPAHVAAARLAAVELEERFREVLGLASELTPGSGDATGMVPLDLAQYAADLEGLLRAQAERAGVALLVSAPAQAVAMQPRLLSPILVNLAANAIRHTPRGGQVRIDAHLDGNSMRWNVSDSGPGLARDLAERIAAACSEGLVQPGTPGIGLGFALILANAQALSGRVQLVANTPSGAHFTLSVPIAGTPRR